ncbi:heme ABC transporter permease [Abyssibius alkaniclasticus]|uniref:heme ABC transporter permease n=1 Tax=Abyssibius alkaniclasticus TaxID=2881234 RepID=UPI0023645022|nr:heme ABC transporter permease [Abyssibius alkaniclasticus]UPH72816.1 heme ABC transporter permease [Abyssibius alkaniclasticus]
MSFWEFANPARFMRLSARLLPWFGGLTLVALGGGLLWGFFLTPDADLFGSTVKIIYLHVPSAFLAVNIYFMMFVTSLIWLIRRHHVSALAAKSAAPIGAAMTLIALITGALWGQPMWGTWWVWDPRLTSFLIMFVFYLGYIALWAAIDEPDKAADLTSILALVGTVFAVLSRYAVNFWSQGLHQGASLSMDRAQNVANVYWFPLVLTIVGFFALFIWLLLIGTRSEIRARRLRALEMQGAR